MEKGLESSGINVMNVITGLKIKDEKGNDFIRIYGKNMWMENKLIGNYQQDMG